MFLKIKTLEWVEEGAVGVLHQGDWSYITEWNMHRFPIHFCNKLFEFMTIFKNLFFVK